MKAKKVALMLILAILLPTLVGCKTNNIIKSNNKEQQETKIVEYNGYVIPWQNYSKWEYDKNTIISNYNELKNYCDKMEENDFNTYRAYHSIEVFSKYDDEYFKTKSLAIICVELSDGTKNIEFKKATKDGKNVKVEYEISQSEGYGIQVISYGFIVVEIDKDITNVL